MTFYRRYVLPRLVHFVCGRRLALAERERIVPRARGTVLEIGFGTGRNLPHYPPGVSRIEAIDPDADLDRFSLPRIAASSVAVDFHHLNAEHLPFEGDSFDTVVCTLTLCSIPDVVHALGEVHRVLRPGGQFLFLEHGLSPDARVARWQHRLNPIQNRIGGGCHLIRETVPLVAGSGLHLRDAEHYYLRRVPRFVGYMTEGSALKS